MEVVDQVMLVMQIKFEASESEVLISKVHLAVQMSASAQKVI